MKDGLNVKVGDKVLYRFGDVERIDIVTKVTPTGQIRIKQTGDKFNKYGVEMGISPYRLYGAYLSIPSEEDYKRVEEKEVIDKAYAMIWNRKKESISYEMALKIIEIFGGN